jgi:hypothetical protein
LATGNTNSSVFGEFENVPVSGKESNMRENAIFAWAGRPRLSGRTGMATLGIVLLATWLVWGAASVRMNRLRAGRFSWLPVWNTLGIDFYCNYWCARSWLSGADPYRTVYEAPVYLPYSYPPACLWHFAWCGLFTEPRPALAAWLAAAAGIIVWAALTGLRVRQDLRLYLPPWPLAVALVLFSSPVVFELERGNCNVLVLLHLLLAAVALRRNSFLADALAGLLLGVAFWIKIYPLLVIAGLLPLWRRRAFVCASVAVVLVAAVDVHGLQGFRRNVAVVAPLLSPGVHGTYSTYAHPLGAWWKLLWRGTGWDQLGRFPELLSASCLLLPLVGWVSLAVFRLPAQARMRMVFPYFLWLAGAGTFFSPQAFDYNLLFLPLAALAAWDRRDPLLVSLLMGSALLWLQPFGLPFDPFLMMGFKLACVLALAVSLHTRCVELAQPALGSLVQDPEPGDSSMALKAA